MGFNTNREVLRAKRIESYLQQWLRFQETIQKEVITKEGEYLSPDKVFKVGNILNEMARLEGSLRELGYTFNNKTSKFND